MQKWIYINYNNYYNIYEFIQKIKGEIVGIEVKEERYIANI